MNYCYGMGSLVRLARHMPSLGDKVGVFFFSLSFTLLTKFHISQHFYSVGMVRQHGRVHPRG